MSDSLRDRIAAAIKAEDEKPHVCPFDGEPTMASYDRLADAVIAALGLRPETGQRSNPTGPLWGGNNRHTVTRYVTDWTTDE